MKLCAKRYGTQKSACYYAFLPQMPFRTHTYISIFITQTYEYCVHIIIIVWSSFYFQSRERECVLLFLFVGFVGNIICVTVAVPFIYLFVSRVYFTFFSLHDFLVCVRVCVSPFISSYFCYVRLLFL